MIRLAKSTDAADILTICAPYVKDTSITFETEVPAHDVMASRIANYLQNWPWLVAEIDGTIAGYAYASQYRERVAYQWSVECSVYVGTSYFGTGIAAALYKKLFALLSQQQFTTVYAVINLPNERSVSFHEKMGFTYFATYEKVGYKLGQWKNVGWWQLPLNECINEPPAPIRFSLLDKKIIDTTLLE
jgi:L-amino acid N-acyltransferase YncA